MFPFYPPPVSASLSIFLYFCLRWFRPSAVSLLCFQHKLLLTSQDYVIMQNLLFMAHFKCIFIVHSSALLYEKRISSVQYLIRVNHVLLRSTFWQDDYHRVIQILIFWIVIEIVSTLNRFFQFILLCHILQQTLIDSNLTIA